MGQHNSQDVYIINIANDSILHTLKLPDGVFGVWSLATQQDTGQILIGSPQGVVLFKSVSERPRLFTNTPITQEALVMVAANKEQFLVGVRWGTNVYLVDAEVAWHTVNALNGEDGVWLTNIMDVAVWENCVYVADHYGPLVLLCPV